LVTHHFSLCNNSTCVF